MTDGREASERAGLSGSARRLGTSLLQVLLTRLDILSTEVAEERSNLARLVIVLLALLVCMQAGLLLAVLFIVLVLGRQHEVAAVGITALVLMLLALACVLWLRWWLKSRPAMFGTTISELRKDRDRLRGGKS